MANTQTVKPGPQRSPVERRRQEQYWRRILREQARSGVTTDRVLPKAFDHAAPFLLVEV